MENKENSKQHFETIEELKDAIPFADSATSKIDQVLQNYGLLKLTMQVYDTLMFSVEKVATSEVLDAEEDFVNFLKRKAVDTESLTECLQVVTAYIATLKEFTLHELVEEEVLLTDKEVKLMREEFGKMLDDPKKNKLVLLRLAGVGGHFTSLILKAIYDSPEFKEKARKMFEVKLVLATLASNLSVAEEILADLYFPYKKAQMLNQELYNLGIIVKQDGTYLATDEAENIINKSSDHDDAASIGQLFPPSPEELAKLNTLLAQKLVVREPIDNLGITRIFKDK